MTYYRVFIDGWLIQKADKLTTYTKTELDDSLAIKVNASELHLSLMAYYDRDIIDTLLGTERIARRDGFSELENTVLNIYVALETKKADKATTYTKTENDNLLNLKANTTSLANYYTQPQIKAPHLY